MINPFKYTPVKKIRRSWAYHSEENKWGIVWHKSQFKKVVERPTCLIEKGLYKRIERFIASVPVMQEFQKEMERFEKQLNDTLSGQKTDPKKEHGIAISKKYQELHKKAQHEWKIRLDAGDGRMIFQYNAKNDLFLGQDIRQVAVVANEVTGERSQQNVDKISWLEYFYLEFKTMAVGIYCKINNFIHRKEIAREIEKSKKEYNDWHKKMVGGIKNEGK